MSKIDDIDLKILKELYDLKPEEAQTTTDIAKKIFDIKERWELRKKDSFVRVRLDKLAGENLITIEKVNGNLLIRPTRKMCYLGRQS